MVNERRACDDAGGKQRDPRPPQVSSLLLEFGDLSAELAPDLLTSLVCPPSGLQLQVLPGAATKTFEWRYSSRQETSDDSSAV